MPVELQDNEVIRSPLVSEKSTFLANVKNAYTFEVDKKADKAQIRKAVENLYKVKVVDVRTVNVAGKPRRTRSGEKTTAAWKKAIVQLDPDHKIDLF
jgi:large subunit ribosomal protein L23